MTDNELLLAISNIVKAQIQPIEKKLNRLEVTLENEIMPRLQNIEACYTSTYNRYADGIDRVEAMQTDIEILKKVVTEHSEKLQKIS